MTISVVIPAYNEEKYLPKTLASLNELDRKPDEVIVIDGGSTDRTPQVAREHNALCLMAEHRGIGYARQMGLKHAASDIVAYTDADTIVPRNWLTVIEETLSQPGVVGMFGSFRVPTGWWIYRIYVNRVQPAVNRIYWRFGVPMAPGQNIAFWKEKALSVGGFPEEYKIAEDIEMARRLMTIGKVVFRHDLIVTSSGRRGNEGVGLIVRIIKAFFHYFIFRKAKTI
jgi:glycosyltransferase involved in cell wall biosynthesis